MTFSMCVATFVVSLLWTIYGQLVQDNFILVSGAFHWSHLTSGMLRELQICPGLNANETQNPYDEHHSVLFSEKSLKHTQFCQTWSNIKMSNNLAKYEVLIEQYLGSILDIRGELVDKAKSIRFNQRNSETLLIFSPTGHKNLAVLIGWPCLTGSLFFTVNKNVTDTTFVSATIKWV